MKVPMLGPGTGVTGGIAALIDAIVPEVRRHAELLYVPTVVALRLAHLEVFGGAEQRFAASQSFRFSSSMTSAFTADAFCRGSLRAGADPHGAQTIMAGWGLSILGA